MGFDCFFIGVALFEVVLLAFIAVGHLEHLSFRAFVIKGICHLEDLLFRAFVI
jgi:hypothetical protein